jgi:hypothetical protein
LEGNVSISPINRQFIASQGIIKGVGSKLSNRKKSNKEMKQQPKQQMKQQPKQQPKPKVQNYGATKEDSAFSKRSGIPLSEVMAQGGVTPMSVMKEIEKQGAYTVRMKPSGLYKKTTKKK